MNPAGIKVWCVYTMTTPFDSWNVVEVWTTRQGAKKAADRLQKVEPGTFYYCREIPLNGFEDCSRREKEKNVLKREMERV